MQTNENYASESEKSKIENNEKNFPDINFRTFISNKLDKFGNGYLTKNFIDKITVLECTGKEIKSLQGIEYFTNLTDLNCNVNKLKELDVSNNPVLREIHCDCKNSTQVDRDYDNYEMEI